MESNEPLTQGVYSPTSGTSTQPKHTTRTSEEKLTQETLQPSAQTKSPTMTFLSGDSLARLSALLESEQDLTTPEAQCSLKSLGFLPTKTPNIFYSKTSKVYLVTTLDELSRQSLKFLPTWGMELNGRYLTAKTSEFPKTESECSLSGILEETVDDKYFLSEQVKARLLKFGLRIARERANTVKTTMPQNQNDQAYIHVSAA